MEPDLGPAADLDSLHGGLLDPLVDRILVDTVSQQQGWLRVYGKDFRFRESGCFRGPNWTSQGSDPETRSGLDQS